MPLPSLTRRALITGAGTAVASAALASSFVHAAHEVVGPTLDLTARFEAARAEYKAAAQALYPDISDWNDKATETGVVMIGLCPPLPVEFTGYGVYEIKVGKVTPIVAMAASESGLGYHWQLYWRDRDGNHRFQGHVHFATTDAVTIVRKIDKLA